MKVANLTHVKNELSYYVEQARQGRSVRILVRGTPVADLVPVKTSAAATGEGWTAEEIDDLVRRGVLRRGAGKGWPPELDQPGPKATRAVTALLAERRQSTR